MARKLILPLVLLTALTSCSGLDVRDAVKKPSVSVSSASLTGLSFTEADVLVQLQVKNPNPLGVKLSGINYHVQVDGSTFVRGNMEKGLDIGANATSQVDVPVTLVYQDLFQSLESLIDQDRSRYAMDLTLSFGVPVLGNVDVPVHTEGDLPLLRLPKVRLARLKLQRLTLSGAQLVLDVGVDNPNGFGLGVSRLDYELYVDGSRWVEGETAADALVPENGSGMVSIPVNLDFAAMGPGVTNLLNGGSPLDYRLEGALGFTTSLDLVGETVKDFSLSGTADLAR